MPGIRDNAAVAIASLTQLLQRRPQQYQAHLLLAGFHDARIGMTSGGDAEGGGEIEILAAFDVPDVVALSAFPDDGPGAIRFREQDVARFVGLQLAQDLLCFRGHQWLNSGGNLMGEGRCATRKE